MKVSEEPVVGRWPDGLVDHYVGNRLQLVRVALLLIGDERIAEEVVQEAYLRVRPHWDRIENHTAYVRRAVVNGCHSWGRRQQLERRRSDREPVEEFAADELFDALALLDDRRRTAVVLRYYADLPDGEIAFLLGCRPSTVRSLIHRGLKQLRRELSS